MSLPKQTTINCSKCGHPITATVFESINTDYSEDIADKIIGGELFEAKCPNCGFVLNMEYDILYNDMKHGAMIMVLHENTSDYDRKVSEIRNTPAIYKNTRIVADISELKEKVSCLENNRDDKIIELCKVFAVYNLIDEYPNFEFKSAYYKAINGKDYIYLYDVAGKEMICEHPNNMYDYLFDLFYNSDYATRYNKKYEIIDYTWAEKLLVPLLKTDPNNEKYFSLIEDEVESENPSGIVCKSCKRELPNDSEFCQYCGLPLGNKTPIITAKDIYKSAEKKRIATPKTSKRFGSAIEKKIMVCHGCGEKHFKGIALNEFLLYVVAFILVVSCALNVYQFISARDQQSEINDLEQTISSNKETITQLREDLDKVKAEKKSQEIINGFELDFFEKYAVLIDSGSSKYHKYGCDYFEGSYFWIFNIEYAEDNGYTECPYCH